MTNEQPDGAAQEPTWHLSSPPPGQTPVPHVIAEDQAAAAPVPGPTAHDPDDGTANMAALDLGRPSVPSTGTAARPGRTYLMTAGLVGAGVIAGIAAVTGLQTLRSTPSAQTTQTARQGVSPQLPGTGGDDGQLPQGQLPQGQLPQGQVGGQAGGQPGGMDGEQRVQGTVTAKSGSTITVALSSGSVTVTVVDRTEIVNNGARATLAQVAVGSKVFMHTFPLDGATVAERIVVGTMPPGGPGGSGHGPDDNGNADVPTAAASGATI